MTINLTVNGVSYPFPEPDDEDWGQNVTDWAQAVTGGMLQKAGGNFSLTADANFGASYGLVSTYFKSRQSNISTAGVLRLAVGDVVGWRNNANSANLPLGVDSSDRLTFNGTPVQNVLSVTDTTTIDLTLAADVLSAAVVAGSLTNTQISASAAIARSKLASGTASHVLINDGSGVMSSEAQLAISRGGTGQATKTEAFDALAPTTTKGDLIAFNGTDNVRVAVGTNGQVLTADSGQTSGLSWTSTLTNPMDGAGQMIYGAVAGAATKLVAGSANQMLQANGTSAPTWNFIVNANVDAAAAIAYSKLALTGSIVNADINASAAIAYSKLNLSNSIVNADVNTSAAIAYSKLNLTDSIVNADINTAAAIAYSKLALSNSIVNADINTSAAIAYSKLSLSNSIVNADINTSAAIAYSKLNLTNSIANADINSAAAIAYSKLAALTASRALVSDGSGFVAVSTVSTTQLQYLASATGTTGTTSTNLVFSGSPSLTTPTLGVASATSINKVAITAPATSATLTLIDGTTLTGPAASGTVMTLGNAETVSGVKSFNDGTVKLNGSSSGSGTLKAPAAASTYTWTLPAATDTLMGLGIAQTVTGAKTFGGQLLLSSASNDYMLKSSLGNHGVYWNNTASSVDVYIGGTVGMSIAAATAQVATWLGVGAAPTTTYPFYFLRDSNSAYARLRVENTLSGASVRARVEAINSDVEMIMDADKNGSAGYLGTNSAYQLNIVTSGATRYNITSDGLHTWTSKSINSEVAYTFNVPGSSIDASADVAISVQFTGDTDPTNGSFIRFGRSGNTSIGRIYADTASTVAYLTSSDTRIKDNQRPIEVGLAEIRNLKPKSYEIAGLSDFGLVAQEAFEVMPKIVYRPRAENVEELWGINYPKLIPVLVAAIQELDREIRILKGEPV